MRAVLYTRVSSDPHQTSRSVDEQEAECRALCERNGWDIVRVFSDNDRSASRHARAARPQYAELKAFLIAGGADMLVMWEGSRAQRDLDAFVKLRDLCADRGIQYCYSGRVYDLSRTDDRFSTGLDALLAEREADVTRDRVLRSMRAGAAKGRPHGKLLYGYRREYDERGQYVRQVIDDLHAGVIREVARRVLTGEATNAICNNLNDRKVPAPRGGVWNPVQIKRLATNPAYAAQRVHQGQVIGEAAWPAIVDDATFGACVARLADPHRVLTHDRSLKYMLSGMATCGVCGGRLKAFLNRGIFTYSCWGDRGRRIDGKRFCVTIATYKLDDYVSSLVIARLSQPDAFDVFAPADQTDAVGTARLEVTELRRRLDEFYASAAEGKVTPAGLAAIEARLLPQIEAAERRTRVTTIPPEIRDLPGPGVDTRWPRLPVAIRRQVVGLLMDVRLHTIGKGKRTFDPSRVEIVWRTA